MKSITCALQQVYAHDAVLCISIALLHNTVKLSGPCVQDTAASHLAFSCVSQLFA